MAFNSAFQPILTDAGVLALGCQAASINSSSIGGIEDSSFRIEGSVTELKTGYPLTTNSVTLNSMTATASLTCLELGACKSLLSDIANSISTGIVPTVDLDLLVFKPRGKDLTISFSGIALLQQFELNFNNDFNTLNINFEQLSDSTLDSVISVTEASSVNSAIAPALLSADNISIGFAKAGSYMAVQGVTLRLSTEYERLEVGYPRVLKNLIPLGHTVELEIASEEFTDTAILEVFSQGTASDVLVQVGLFNGTAIDFTIKSAVLQQSTSASISRNNFSTLTKKFIGTGSTLLTVA